MADFVEREEFDAFAEVGRAGLKVFGGLVDEEFVRELRGDKGRRTYREMSENDPIVAACLMTTRQFLRQIPVDVEGEDERSAELVRTALGDMSRTWSDVLTEILTMLVYGWSALEIVYKRRGGDAEDPSRRSKYSDGLIGWRKLAPRAQESLRGWVYDDEESVRGLEQLPAPSYRLVTIPIEKLLLFRTETIRDNPEGRSLLRGAYQPWFFARRIKVIEGVGIERDLAGLPVVRIPSSVIARGGAVYEAYKDLGRNLRRDEQESVVLPSDRDASGNLLYELELLSTGGARQFDTNEIVRRYQVEVATALLADFVLLGHNQVGSYALANSKNNVFTIALAGWMDSILEVFNRFAIPRLLVLNGMSTATPPKLVRGDIVEPDLAGMGQYITALAGAFPEVSLVPGLLDHLLRAGGLPTLEGDTEVGKRVAAVVEQVMTNGDNVPPKGAREEAERGLAWRREYGRGGTEIGIARARDIANGANLSDDTVRRMVSYFARHEVDKQGEGWSPGEPGYPSNGRIAWALWGGDAGRRWAEARSE